MHNVRRAALLATVLLAPPAFADADDDAVDGIADRLLDTELESKNRYASFDAVYDVYGADGPFWAYGGCGYTLAAGKPPRIDCHVFVSLSDKKKQIDIVDAGDAKKREAGRTQLRKVIRKFYQGGRAEEIPGHWMRYFALTEGKPITFGTQAFTWDAKKRVLSVDDPKEKLHYTLAAPKLKHELDETKAGMWLDWNPDDNTYGGGGVLLRVHTESDKGASEDAIVKS